ncbi:peptidoglycan-binding protein [Actinomadura sp. ATCC 31491]|uniref:Peptidoglycan-binding protein n=1 Tax=Actinomadura luzonensis TaxID=2805427 RepID=A0ABT0FVX9_9ACTN|nr:peptidoglycan-binding protein [Actinomadura luzonensis]MCK2216318.1 peptidoglycan-binding protein [Actinomadura luzonensis]
MRGKGLLLGGGAVLAVAGTWTAVAVLHDGPAAPAAAPAAPPTVPATAEVTRRDLVETKTVDGALTYAGERQLTAGGSGVVTWVPAQGAVVRRGRPLIKVDRRPTVLMYGALPLYRTLRLGVSDGPDVEQLERNLKALGHGSYLTVDGHFSGATRQAVLDWQEDRGLPETGEVDAAQVVFQPAAVRVTEARAAVGDRVAPGRQVLTVSGMRRLVHVDLDTADQSLARKGARVTVTLPGGERAAGRITSIGMVAEVTGQEPDTSTTVDVDITLAERPRTRLDQAPVEVELQSARHAGVLAVPVEALLALREGGFGVEVVTGSGTRIVAVETGAFGGGLVEVEGEGLREGMKVGVPAT